MKRYKIALATLMTCAAVFSGAAWAIPSSDEMASTELNSLYWHGHQALGKGDWDLALQRFTELERRLRQSEPDAVDAAIYWRAYALVRAGRPDEAQAVVKRLLHEFPHSRWNRDASELLSSGVRTNSAESVEEGEAELELLLSQPPARAIPRLIELMESSSSSARLRKRALFVLSQMNDPGALIQMTAIARGRDPILRAEAMRLLTIAGLDENIDPASDSSPAVARKREIVDAMHVVGADQALVETARSSVNASVRYDAVQALGRARSFAALTDLAVNHQDLKTRQHAIRALSNAGGRRSLVELYPRVNSIPVLRDEVLRGILANNDAQALHDIGSKARSIEEKEAVRRVLEQARVNDAQ